MYTLTFTLSFFQGEQAWSREYFTKVGPGHIRVKQVDTEAWHENHYTEVWEAKSRKPFMIAVITKAGGADDHLNDNTVILVADQCRLWGTMPSSEVPLNRLDFQASMAFLTR